MKRHDRPKVNGGGIETRLAAIAAVAGVTALGSIVWAEVETARGAPYLSGQPPLDYRTVLGPPPAPGSPQAESERAQYEANARGIGGADWQRALRELSPASPEVIAALGCAAGKRLAPPSTPATLTMIANLSADLRPAISASKTVFRRDRPFVGQSDARTCDPRAREGRDPDALSFSYPSGHAAFGELWALALSDAVPAARPRILAWGRQLGDDRVVCRVHYPSDVAAGRRLADALFARIKASPRFQADLKAAQSELARVAAPANCPA